MSDDFWDKRATILRRQGKVARGEVGLPRGPAPENADALFEVSVREVGLVSFDEELERLGVQRSFFMHMDTLSLGVGAAIGFAGALSAIATERLSQRVEDHPLLQNADGKHHPADYWTGANHRYIYGHDILNPRQGLPDGFLYRGQNVGGRSLLDLVMERFQGTNSLTLRVVKSFLSLSLHYGRDLLTPQGMPLPGSSHFTKWSKSLVNVCGFSSENELMGVLGREFGSLSVGDIAAAALIKVLAKRFAVHRAGQTGLDDGAMELLHKQVRAIAIGTCISLQLAMLLAATATDPAVRKKVAGAKANLILVGMLGMDVFDIWKMVSAADRAVSDHYRRSLTMLRDDSKSFEEWAGAL